MFILISSFRSFDRGVLPPIGLDGGRREIGYRSTFFGQRDSWRFFESSDIAKIGDTRETSIPFKMLSASSLWS